MSLYLSEEELLTLLEIKRNELVNTLAFSYCLTKDPSHAMLEALKANMPDASNFERISTLIHELDRESTYWLLCEASRAIEDLQNKLTYGKDA